MDAALPPVTGSATLVPRAFREFLHDPDAVVARILALLGHLVR